jgi:hypothetical protein
VTVGQEKPRVAMLPTGRCLENLSVSMETVEGNMKISERATTSSTSSPLPDNVAVFVAEYGSNDDEKS